MQSSRRCSLSALGLFLISAGPLGCAAEAVERNDTEGELIAEIEAPMVIDCAHMTDEAKADAAEHGLCTKPGNGGDLSTEAWSFPAVGDCGTSRIGVFALGFGEAEFRWELNSTRGSMISRSLVVEYQRQGGPTAFILDGPVPMWPTNPYHGRATRHTGVGLVRAELGGSVTTSQGYVCFVLHPETADFIW